MRSTYFIIDFSYNPADTKPLAIFEFGDAFESAYPDKKMYQKQFTPHQCLLENIKSLYPESLFVKLDGNGLACLISKRNR